MYFLRKHKEDTKKKCNQIQTRYVPEPPRRHAKIC
nr:MAG TPA: hypothetical protein [Caudoviricetes sp.]